MMLTKVDLDRIVTEAAITASTRRVVKRAFGVPASDGEGRDILDVTVVIDSKERALDGDAALDIIVRIQEQLQAAGDDRFAVVEFATEAELEQETHS